MAESPKSCRFSWSNLLLSSVHLFFSPLSDSINCLAPLTFFAILFNISCWASFFCLTSAKDSSNFFFSAKTSAFLFCWISNNFIASANFLLINSTFCCLGITSLTAYTKSDIERQNAASLLQASPPILAATSSENNGSSFEVFESKKGLKSSKVSSLIFN